MINDALLEDYIELFFGYGNLNAPIWFVGMEEGGEPDAASFNNTLLHWAAAGKEHVVDIAPRDTVSKSKWFNSDKPPIQRTWGKLIRSALHALGEEVSLNTIRAYQAKRLARCNSETCLLELMPLPAKNVGSWTYDKDSNLDYLKSRNRYMNQIAPAREIALAALIDANHPKVVVFYSTQYFDRWQNIVGADVNWTEETFGKVSSRQSTTFYCVPHPTAFGVGNSHYDALGDSMKKVLSKS